MNLTDAKLAGANLTRAKLWGLVLAGYDLTNANLTDAELFSVDLTGANLTGANLSNAYLFDAILTNANLTNAKVTGTDLRQASVAGIILRGADLTGFNFKQVKNLKLAGTDLTATTLAGARMGYEDLRGANLTSANLTGTDLVGANLNGANLTAANLTAADLRGATLTGVAWDRATCPDGKQSSGSGCGRIDLPTEPEAGAATWYGSISPVLRGTLGAPIRGTTSLRANIAGRITDGVHGTIRNSTSQRVLVTTPTSLYTTGTAAAYLEPGDTMSFQLRGAGQLTFSLAGYGFHDGSFGFGKDPSTVTYELNDPIVGKPTTKLMPQGVTLKERTWDDWFGVPGPPNYEQWGNTNLLVTRELDRSWKVSPSEAYRNRFGDPNYDKEVDTADWAIFTIEILSL